MKDKESLIGEYKYWEPEGVTIPKLIYELKSFLWDWEKVQFIYDDTEGTQVEITFDINMIISCRWADESDRLRTVDEFIYRIKKDNKDIRLVFELKNSEFQRWYHEETYGMFSDNRNIRHFIFPAANDLVDVLALREPEVVVKTYKIE